MLASQTPEVRAASERFSGFFKELGRTFVERDDLLTQVALALLAREHVLMTGPPGTAKSGVAAAVLGRIVDERTGKPSVFARQFTESTVQTDLVGPIDFKTLMATGRTEHFTDEGMLGAVHAFLDEVLDGRDMLLRTTLNVLHERELKQGAKTDHHRPDRVRPHDDESLSRGGPRRIARDASRVRRPHRVHLVRPQGIHRCREPRSGRAIADRRRTPALSRLAPYDPGPRRPPSDHRSDRRPRRDLRCALQVGRSAGRPAHARGGRERSPRCRDRRSAQRAARPRDGPTLRPPLRP